jgi:hypothetical protein
LIIKIYEEECIVLKIGTSFDERHARAINTVKANSTHCAGKEKIGR